MLPDNQPPPGSRESFTRSNNTTAFPQNLTTDDLHSDGFNTFEATAYDLPNLAQKNSRTSLNNAKLDHGETIRFEKVGAALGPELATAGLAPIPEVSTADLRANKRRSLLDRLRLRRRDQPAFLDQPSDEKISRASTDTSGSGERSVRVNLLDLFRFSTPLDWVLMVIGTIAAIAAGSSQPLMTVIFANTLQGLSDYTYQNSVDHEVAANNLNQSIDEMLKWFGILAGATFVASYLQIFCWSYAGERQCRRMRELYYESILRQE
ncbi:hypothetical protein IWQ60_012025, partial [Tieghemiomyces parasiticus]